MITSGFSLGFNGKALLNNSKEMLWQRDIYQLTTNRVSANKSSGFSGETVEITNNSPAWNEKFSGYSITGATLTGNTFTFTNSDVTAQANYETAKNVTTATDGHGTITASPKSGFIGTQVTLTNTPNAGYIFQNYSITGATLTGNKFNLMGDNVTAKANFYKEPVRVNVSGVFGPSAYVRNLFEPFTHSAEIRNHHFNIANSGPTTIGGVITAFGGPLTRNMILQYSSYYSAFTASNTFCTGMGITKPVHITRVCYQTNGSTYSYDDIKFGSGANGPWHTGNVNATYVGSSAIRYYNNMDFITNSKLSISANPLSVFANLDSTLHFTGYIET